MNEHNLEEFEYSRGDLRIRLRKPSAGMVMLSPSRSAYVPEIIVAGSGSGADAGGWLGKLRFRRPKRDRSEDLHLIKSPIVGTFYGAPSPGAEAFVKVGDACGERADVLHRGSHEADERNRIGRERRSVRVFVENGQPVEYGQPLFGIRPSRKK